jgi:hypothetical protein
MSTQSAQAITLMVRIGPPAMRSREEMVTGHVSLLARFSRDRTSRSLPTSDERKTLKFRPRRDTPWGIRFLAKKSF